ncbi:MAG: DNA cytosine methyltransferase [Planctomycetia bacterium]|nr:DNA cytosine methyltransferase [Planctomycetia bacterium]
MPRIPVISCVDLFCGLGGLTHGLTEGGVNVTLGVDLDPHCKYPYEQNNDASFLTMNVEDVTSKTLEPFWRNGSYRLLAGCAPCQPFSTFSRTITRLGRKIERDQKWDLVAEFGRLVKEVKPDFVTMENVPQVADHSVFKDFTKSLKGYHVWHSAIQCSDYGIPQTRRRLVLLASRLGPLELQSPNDNDHKKSTVKKAILNLPRLSAGECDPQDALHAAPRLSPLNLRRIKASVPGGTWRDWKSSLVASCHKKKSGETFPGVYGRMEWDQPAPTITTQSFSYGTGRFGHPEQDRAITLREAAILQTFPRNYRFLRAGERANFSVLGRLIGNAVPVRLGEVIATTLISHIKSYKRSD